MQTTDIQNQVLDIVSDVMETPRPEVTANASSDTLANWDSMTQMALTLALQEHFKVRFVSTQATGLSSVKLIVAALDGLINPK